MEPSKTPFAMSPPLMPGFEPVQLRPVDILRRVALAVCILLALGGGGWYVWIQFGRTNQAEHPLEAHWRLARDLLAQWQYARSRDELRVCLAATPFHAETNFLMARACRGVQDYDGWQQYLEHAAELQWSPEEIWLERTLRQAEAGFGAPVERPLLEYMQKHPAAAPLVYEALAEGDLQNRRYRELWQLAAAWTERYPRDWLAWRYRGDAFFLDGGTTRAIPEYEHALQCAPDPNLVRPYLAVAYVEAKRYQDALAVYQANVKDRPQDPLALFGVAMCQNVLANETGARDALTQLLRIAPDNIDGLLLEGKLELDAGQAQQALARLRKAERLAPWRGDVLSNLASAYRQLNEKTAADACTQRLGKINDVLRDIAKLQLQLHKKPQDAALRYQIAQLYRQTGNLGEALRWYSGALAVDPTHVASRRALIQLTRQVGAEPKQPGPLPRNVPSP